MAPEEPAGLRIDRSGLTLDAAATHLYPGARGTLRKEGMEAPEAGEQACMVLFADGTFAFATLAADGLGGWELAADPHTTAQGTAIPAKRWRLATGGSPGGGTGIPVRVEARL